ncbi:MAG: hypothetical protein ACYCOS_06570 [Sulfobacillus sp.]
MPWAGVWLVLLSSGLHVSWNALLKIRPSLVALGQGMVATGIVGVAVGLALGQRIGPGGWVFLLASATIHIAYYLLLNRGYQLADLSAIYPLARGLGVAVMPLAVAVLLGVATPVAAWIGILVVGTGSVLMAKGEHIGAIWPALALGAVIAAYSLTDSQGVHLTPPILYMSTASIITGAALLATQGRRAWALGQLAAGSLIGGLSLVGYLFMLAAYQIMPVASALALRQLAIPMALIWAWRQKEAIGRRRVLAAGMIVLGAVVIALG